MLMLKLLISPNSPFMNQAKTYMGKEKPELSKNLHLFTITTLGLYLFRNAMFKGAIKH